MNGCCEPLKAEYLYPNVVQFVIIHGLHHLPPQSNQMLQQSQQNFKNSKQYLEEIISASSYNIFHDQKQTREIKKPRRKNGSNRVSFI